MAPVGIILAALATLTRPILPSNGARPVSDLSPRDLYWRLDAIYNAPDAARRWANLAMLIVEWTPDDTAQPLLTEREHRAAARRERIVRTAVAVGETREKVVMLRERLREITVSQATPERQPVSDVTQSDTTQRSTGGPMRLAALALALLPAVAAAEPDHRAREAAIDACVSQIRTADASSDFDAFYDPRLGKVRWIGTPREGFDFQKCLAKKGLSIADKPGHSTVTPPTKEIRQ